MLLLLLLLIIVVINIIVIIVIINNNNNNGEFPGVSLHISFYKHEFLIIQREKQKLHSSFVNI